MRTFFLALIAVALVACGSDGGSSTTTGATKDKFGNCYGSSNEECTGVDEYTTCLTGKCDAEYNECFGAGYLSGTWGGLCGVYIQCTIACDCGDTACYTACGTGISQECSDCLASMATCVQNAGCTMPDCQTTGGGGSACDEFKKCCDKLTGIAQCDSVNLLSNEQCETIMKTLGGQC